MILFGLVSLGTLALVIFNFNLLSSNLWLLIPFFALLVLIHGIRIAQNVGRRRALNGGVAFTTENSANAASVTNPGGGQTIEADPIGSRGAALRSTHAESVARFGRVAFWIAAALMLAVVIDRLWALARDTSVFDAILAAAITVLVVVILLGIPTTVANLRMSKTLSTLKLALPAAGLIPVIRSTELITQISTRDERAGTTRELVLGLTKAAACIYTVEADPRQLVAAEFVAPIQAGVAHNDASTVVPAIVLMTALGPMSIIPRRRGMLALFPVSARYRDSEIIRMNRSVGDHSVRVGSAGV